jgi:hypothetical protein
MLSSKLDNIHDEQTRNKMYKYIYNLLLKYVMNVKIDDDHLDLYESIRYTCLYYIIHKCKYIDTDITSRLKLNKVIVHKLSDIISYSYLWYIDIYYICATHAIYTHICKN